MTDAVDYFLNATPNVVALDTLEIAHSAFSKTYYLVRNAADGLTAFLEDGVEMVFEYVPMNVRKLASSNNLDQSIGIDLGDLGEILPLELDRVREQDGFSEKPIVSYRQFRSDDLAGPMDGPFDFETKTFSFNQEGASFEASAVGLNDFKTGEIYSITRFPMRGFL